MGDNVKVRMIDVDGETRICVDEESLATLAGDIYLDKKALAQVLHSAVRNEAIQLFKELGGETIMRSKFNALVEKEVAFVKNTLHNWVDAKMKECVCHEVAKMLEKMKFSVNVVVTNESANEAGAKE